jgi:integrase
VTLDDYLDEWFALQRTRLEPTSWHNYRTMARIYLQPALGATPLTALTTRQLDLHYVRLLEDGGRTGGPLARRTVAYAHAILHNALGDAVAVGLLDTNPADRAEVPRVDPRFDDAPRRLRTWDADQVADFVRHPQDRELHDLWRVALGTGMRRGELLGLRWEDLDLDVPQLRVAAALTSAGGQLRLKGTKTRRVRTLHLDTDTAEVLARQPRRAPAPHPLVFTRSDGRPWRPEVVTDRWRRQWPGLTLPFVRLHDTRHSHASLLLQAGVPIKVVSERLGHSKVAMTLDVYAHVLPAADRAAAEVIGALVRGSTLEPPGSRLAWMHVCHEHRKVGRCRGSSSPECA